MKTYFRVKLTSLLLSLFLAALPAAEAQKLSRKAIRALRIQEAQEFQKITDAATQAVSTNAAFRAAAGSVAVQMTHRHTLPPTAPSPTSKKARAAFFNEQNIKDAVRVRVNKGKHAPKYTGRLPFQPAQKVEQLLSQHSSPLNALKALWKLEDRFRGTRFFEFSPPPITSATLWCSRPPARTVRQNGTAVQPRFGNAPNQTDALFVRKPGQFPRRIRTEHPQSRYAYALRKRPQPADPFGL